MSSRDVKIRVILDVVNEESIEFIIGPKCNILDVIGEKLHKSNIVVLFGEDEIYQSDTFEDWGIEDGAILSVICPTVAKVVAEVAALNPHLTVEELMENVEVDPKDPSRVVGDLVWNFKRITKLPESFGSLTVGGDLYLSDNQLASLPEGFGSLTVGGDVYLADNRPTTP